MYSICETKLGDVAECIGTMLKNGYKWPLWQVGQKLYKKLEKAQTDNPTKVWEMMQARKAKHVINMTTLTVHKKDCTVLKRTKDACKIGAYLVKPGTAGLKHCKVCMLYARRV